MKTATMSGGNAIASQPKRPANARTFWERVKVGATCEARFNASHSWIRRAVVSCRLSWLSMYRRGSAPISKEPSKVLIRVHFVAVHEPAPAFAFNAVQVSSVHVKPSGPIGGNRESLTAKAGHNHGLAQGELHGVRSEPVKFARSETAKASGRLLGFSALGSAGSPAGSGWLVHGSGHTPTVFTVPLAGVANQGRDSAATVHGRPWAIRARRHPLTGLQRPQAYAGLKTSFGTTVTVSAWTSMASKTAWTFAAFSRRTARGTTRSRVRLRSMET